MPNPDEAPSHEGDVDDVGAIAEDVRARAKTDPAVYPPPAARLRAVLHLSFQSEDRAAYFKGDGLCPIALTWPVWTDMGRPQAITVTIDPGDRLNDPPLLTVTYPGALLVDDDRMRELTEMVRTMLADGDGQH